MSIIVFWATLPETVLIDWNSPEVSADFDDSALSKLDAA